jgi:hypothetical protein
MKTKIPMFDTARLNNMNADTNALIARSPHIVLVGTLRKRLDNGADKRHST